MTPRRALQLAAEVLRTSFLTETSCRSLCTEMLCWSAVLNDDASAHGRGLCYSGS